MFRYAVVLIGAVGTFAAAAVFAQAPAGTPGANAHPVINQTVIAKNSVYPIVDNEPWVACKTEDCSDVPNQ